MFPAHPIRPHIPCRRGRSAGNAWPSSSPPPALVVAHCRTGPVVKARLVAMQAMFALGLKRCQIAAAFGRDLRRVRSSVIGAPPAIRTG